ncbi:MAG: GAF domain-containing protein [Gemmatimonadaceae bacterium]
MPRDSGAPEWSDDALRLLTRAGAVLSSSLDYETTLDAATRLAVPDLGDLCTISIVDDGRSGPRRERRTPAGGETVEIEQLAVAHVVPAKETLARELGERSLLDPRSPAGATQPLRSARAVLQPTVTDIFLEALAQDADQLSALRQLGLRSYMCVPLAVRGWVLGLMVFAVTESGRRYGADDLALAIELASRVATAVDNARLYEAEQRARWSAERGVERMARLNAVTSALSDALMPDAASTVIVRQATHAVGGRTGVLALLVEGGGELELSHSVGYSREFLDAYRRFPVSAPLPLAEAVRTGKPVFLESMMEWVARYPGFVVAESFADEAAWAALPLEAGGEILGALGFEFTGTRRVSAEDRAFMQSVVAQCAQGLVRARLRESEQTARAEATSAERARWMVAVGEALSVARAEPGRESARSAPVRVAGLAREAVAQVTTSAQAKGIALRVEVPEEGAAIRTDEIKLRQALLSLLEHAVGTTERGEVALRVSVADGRAHFVVRDTGGGMAGSDLAHVFEPFWRAEHSARQTADSGGPALSVALHLARLLGGDIEAESVIGEGSTFALWIPAGGASEREVSLHAGASAGEADAPGEAADLDAPSRSWDTGRAEREPERRGNAP